MGTTPLRQAFLSQFDDTRAVSALKKVGEIILGVIGGKLFDRCNIEIPTYPYVPTFSNLMVAAVIMLEIGCEKIGKSLHDQEGVTIGR